GRRGGERRSHDLMSSTRLGVWVLGSPSGERRLVDRRRLREAYCRGDPRVPPEIQAYISPFDYGEDFRKHHEMTGSTPCFRGSVGVPEIHFDIDREGDLEAAWRDTRHLVAYLQDTYQLGGENVAVGLSGNKGSHSELPIVGIEPGLLANLVCRQFAKDVA